MISFGHALLWSALLTALLSMSAYVAARRGSKDARALGRSSFSFIISALAILVTPAALFYAFFHNRFDIACVAAYSSRDLPTLCRISALWAGQEGSLLFWALMGAVMGIAVLRRAGAWETTVMPFFRATPGVLAHLAGGDRDCGAADPHGSHSSACRGASRPEGGGGGGGEQ